MIRLTVIGNIGNDAEIKMINDSKVINFTVAHNERITTKDRVIENVTTWVECSLWVKPDNKLAEYIKKGNKIYLEGYPNVRVYKDKEENIKYSLNLNVNKLELL